MGMYAAETMLGLIIVVAEIGGIDFAVCHEIVARIQRSEVGAGLGEFLNRINSVNPLRRSPGFHFNLDSTDAAAFVPPDHHANDSVTTIAQVGSATTQSVRERCAARGSPRA